MNEFFAADPAICRNSSELRLLLSSFGPYCGRYLANYPKGWSARVEGQLEGLGEIEVARIQTLLRRASESRALVTRASLPWNPDQDWMSNAVPLLNTRPAAFDGLIARQAAAPAIHSFDDLDLPPTADERVAGNAGEYARISKILLLLSPEIAVVDPYLNPLKNSYGVVLKAIFELAGRGRCQRVTLWARAAEVFRSGNEASVRTNLRAKLQALAVHANVKSELEIELVLVRDEDRRTKLHGRYILSIKGGIRLDQGLAQLPNGRQNDVGPIGRATHGDLLDIYFDGKHDMSVTDRIVVTV